VTRTTPHEGPGAGVTILVVSGTDDVSHHDFAWLQSHSGFSTSEILGSDGYYRYQSDTDDTLRTTFDSVHSVQRIDGSGDTRYHGNRGLAGDGWNSNWYEESPSGGGIEVSQGSYHLALTHDDDRPNAYDVTVASGSAASVELPGPYRLPTNPQANTPPSGALGPGGFSPPADPSEVAGLRDQVAAAGSSAAAANAAQDAYFTMLAQSPGNPETPGSAASENSLQGAATMADYAGSQSSLPDSANPAAIVAGATTGLPTTVSGMIGGQGDLCERFPDSCSEASWHPPTRHEESWLEFGDRVRQSVSGSFTGYWSNVGSTLKGYFWTTPKELVSGTLHLVLNPSELLDAAWLIYEHPELVPQGIWDDIKQKASHSEGQGQLAADAVLVLIPVTKVKELARIAQLVKKFGKVLPDGAVPLNGGLASEIAGEAIDPARFARMRDAFIRNGGVVDQSTDAQAYLRLRQAEGLTFDSKTILLPDRPSTSSVFEEFIHATQHRTGRFNQAVDQFGNARAIDMMEIEAAEKLIRNRRAWGIPNAETRQTIERLRGLRGGLGQ
jgi:hypothetical protein